VSAIIIRRNDDRLIHACARQASINGNSGDLRNWPWLNSTALRVWGTHSAGLSTHQQDRFIPTGVGNAPSQEQHYEALAVHPHGCGERVRKSNIEAMRAGSSPRVWGTPADIASCLLRHRFIPTGVGNARNKRENGGIEAVHPHGCGERVKGDCERSTALRFIPTGVGNALIVTYC
jgi:hypothetical protein